jgi:hypothetical protein
MLPLLIDLEDSQQYSVKVDFSQLATFEIGTLGSGSSCRPTSGRRLGARTSLGTSSSQQAVGSDGAILSNEASAAHAGDNVGGMAAFFIAPRLCRKATR